MPFAFSAHNAETLRRYGYMICCRGYYANEVRIVHDGLFHAPRLKKSDAAIIFRILLAHW